VAGALKFIDKQEVLLYSAMYFIILIKV